LPNQTHQAGAQNEERIQIPTLQAMNLAWGTPQTKFEKLGTEELDGDVEWEIIE